MWPKAKWICNRAIKSFSLSLCQIPIGFKKDIGWFCLEGNFPGKEAVVTYQVCHSFKQISLAALREIWRKQPRQHGLISKTELLYPYSEKTGKVCNQPPDRKALSVLICRIQRLPPPILYLSSMESSKNTSTSFCFQNKKIRFLKRGRCMHTIYI